MVRGRDAHGTGGRQAQPRTAGDESGGREGREDIPFRSERGQETQPHETKSTWRMAAMCSGVMP